MAKICQNFKNIVRTYWGSDIAHQIVTDCRKVKEKGKMFSQTSDSDWCQQWNRKKKKKDQSCKDINVKSAAIVTYLETMSNEELLKVEIIKL